MLDGNEPMSLTTLEELYILSVAKGVSRNTSPLLLPMVVTLDGNVISVIAHCPNAQSGIVVTALSVSNVTEVRLGQLQHIYSPIDVTPLGM